MKKSKLTLSQAIDGWTIAANARRLSVNTLNDYGYTFRRFQAFFTGDPEFTSITPKTIEKFMSGLDGLSDKTALNIHTALSSLWHWAADEKIVDHNLVRDVKPPAPEQRAVDPFSREDVKALLGALDRSAPYRRPGKRECTHATREGLRNRAMILLLLDCGLRASELVGLKIYCVDKRNGQVKIVLGKGDKERILPYSPQTGQALWRYLATRSEALANDYVFVTSRGRTLGRDDLCKIITRIGVRAGVTNAHPHRFRHTFAINYLRNGGNVYSLQLMLGHTTLKMCQHYLRLAESDLQAGQTRASVVANWNL
ncbi:MAG: tyrosine-type recombinase/integrase [Azonexus sp.]